jgi:hypothetical protein
MLIVIDDLQWADAVFLLFLTLLSRRSAATGILWLLAFRPGKLSAAASVAVDLHPRRFWVVVIGWTTSTRSSATPRSKGPGPRPPSSGPRTRSWRRSGR